MIAEYLVEVSRVSDCEVLMKWFEWEGNGKRLRGLKGSVRFRWSEFLQYGEIVRLVVKPGARRDGIGSALLEHAERYLRRVGIWRVFVSVPFEADLAVVPFLKARGFVQLPTEGEAREFLRDLPELVEGGAA